MSSSAKIKFEVVSPEAKMIEDQAVMVVVPGEMGDFGAMADHAPLISTIRPGVVKVYRDDMNTATDAVFISGGFADVTGTQCTILADSAEPVSKIDADAVAQELETLRSDYDSLGTEAEKDRYARRMAIASAKLEAVSATS